MTRKKENKPTEKKELKTKLLPVDTNAALREVVTRMSVLNDVFEEETKALNNIDNDTFIALQDKKLAVAIEYQDCITQIMGRKNEIKRADPALRERLKEMQAKFQDISKRNMEALERMHRCTERVGNTIRNAAVKAANKERGYSYGEDGNIPSSAKKRSVSTGLSETV
ncbi:MAG: hypothetical protein GC137_00645 [Alphaproteobacteria bacterium]|nr:hypothetical protein [Alphaproteobacteria bacterium]